MQTSNKTHYLIARSDAEAVKNLLCAAGYTVTENSGVRSWTHAGFNTSAPESIVRTAFAEADVRHSYQDIVAVG